MRPALALLAGRFGDYDLDRLVPLAASVELLHTATLVHDDVIDAADTRRGRPTVNSAFHNATTVMLGDYLFAHAADQVVQDRQPPRGPALLRDADDDGEGRDPPGPGRVRQPPDDPRLPAAHRRQDRLAVRDGLRGRRDRRPGSRSRGSRRCASTATTSGWRSRSSTTSSTSPANEAEMGKPVGSDLMQGTLTLAVAAADGAAARGKHRVALLRGLDAEEPARGR